MFMEYRLSLGLLMMGRFVAPENVSVDDLKGVQFPEGVHVDIHQED